MSDFQKNQPDYEKIVAPILAKGKTEHVKIVEPIDRKIEKDMKRRIFLLNGMQKWLYENHPKAPDVRETMKLLTEAAQKYKSWRVIMTPDVVNNTHWSDGNEFFGELNLEDENTNSSMEIRNLGTRVYEGNLRFRIGLYNTNGESTQEIHHAIVCIDQAVWKFLHLLYPDQNTFYQQPVDVLQGQTDQQRQEAFDQRLSRNGMPLAVRLMLIAVELGNHDFTFHSLIDTEERKSTSVLYDAGLGNSVSSHASKLEEIPLTDSSGITGPALMSVYEMLGFHLHAMAWQTTFREKPSIKKALLRQIVVMNKQLFGESQADTQSLLYKAHQNDQITAQYTEKQIHNVLAYLQNIQLNFLFNALNPDDPEVWQVLTQIGRADYQITTKQKYSHDPELVKKLNLKLGTILKDFNAALKKHLGIKS